MYTDTRVIISVTYIQRSVLAVNISPIEQPSVTAAANLNLLEREDEGKGGEGDRAS